MARKKAKKPLDDDGGYPVEQDETPKPRKSSGEGLIKPATASEIEAVAIDLAVELATLGDTNSAVAKTLAANEIFGERLDDNKCPVANYLKQKVKLPDHAYLSVQHEAAIVLEHFGGNKLCSVPLPKGVIKFIEAWDGGKYNKLAD